MYREQKQILASNFNRKAMINRTHIEIFEMSSFSDRHAGKPPKYGINWGAIGTVDTKETKIFINNLKKAILLCEKLNKR